MKQIPVIGEVRGQEFSTQYPALTRSGSRRGPFMKQLHAAASTHVTARRTEHELIANLPGTSEFWAGLALRTERGG